MFRTSASPARFTTSLGQRTPIAVYCGVRRRMRSVHCATAPPPPTRCTRRLSTPRSAVMLSPRSALSSSRSTPCRSPRRWIMISMRGSARLLRRRNVRVSLSALHQLPAAQISHHKTLFCSGEIPSSQVSAMRSALLLLTLFLIKSSLSKDETRDEQNKLPRLFLMSSGPCGDL